MQKKYRKWWVMGALVLAIKLFSLQPDWVEQYYSRGIYPYMAAAQRWLLGWLPFSLGDIVYGLVVACVLYKIAKGIRLLWKRQLTRQRLGSTTLQLLYGGMVLYVIFNLLWGLNYNRRGITHQLGLSQAPYTTADLDSINRVLLHKLNDCRAVLAQQQYRYGSAQQLFTGVQVAYTAAAKRWPFLQYRPQSLKTSLWGWLGNYTGFTGYYNPFSGEAQVNTTVPVFLQPYIGCHEVAHQLGYAKENEANFAGYLAAVASPDTGFKYSVYLDLFLYANANLSITDSTAAKTYRQQLAPPVQADLAEWKAFVKKHKNPFAPGLSWLYGLYLRSNQQPQGILSYDAVTAFIIAYYKKFGEV